LKHHLHIISFDVPFPANYGGVIDVFYKLKALHKGGVAIHLHCFRHDREESAELLRYCVEVHYYQRRTGACVSLSRKPYIVQGRNSGILLQRLLQDDYPILFEGLHSCFFLNHPKLRNRLKVYRESNIEHQYYYHLFLAEKDPGNKLFFLSESVKLRLFQPVLKHADILLPVSLADKTYLERMFPDKKVVYLPSFHQNDLVAIKPGMGSYVLYHGKLSVPENRVAAEYLLREVFTEGMPELVIAGLDPPDSLVQLASTHPNARLVSNPDDKEMDDLICEAHINIMVTFQATGLKLKLLHSLFRGKFCLVNRAMIAGTTLEPFCFVAEDPESFRSQIRELFTREFTIEDVLDRSSIFSSGYANKKNCKILMETLHLL
jgi:hypothetical protein